MKGKRLHLVRNLADARTLEELRLQLGDIFSRLEDYLGGQINTHYLQSTDKLPTLNTGDLVFSIDGGVATLQQWDGTKLVDYSFAGPPGADGAPGAPGADGTDGADGVGVPTGGTAGQVLTKIDSTDFNTTWSTPSGGGGGSGEIMVNGDLTNPEIMFDASTGEIMYSG